MIRLLVSGGRHYNDYQTVQAWLLYIQQTIGIEVVIHGGASGADALAGVCCDRHNIPQLPFPAQWIAYGLKAGPIRNTQMLDEGKPDMLLAFPGGPGTRNMIKQATERGLPVLKAADMEIPEEFWQSLEALVEGED